MQFLSVHFPFEHGLWPMQGGRLLRRQSAPEQGTIDCEIILGHAGSGEALLEPAADLAPVKHEGARQHAYRLVHGIDNGAGDARLNDFRNRSLPESENRSA